MPAPNPTPRADATREVTGSGQVLGGQRRGAVGGQADAVEPAILDRGHGDERRLALAATTEVVEAHLARRAPRLPPASGGPHGAP